MTTKLKSSLERGLPISLSRWTDVAHWYMPWLQDMMTIKGVIPATDPQKPVLSLWKADPDEVHSLFFWTKYPPKLTSALKTWLSPYRVFTAVTITGWHEVETRVPNVNDQLDTFRQHINLVGPEKVQWRYSPVPNDFGYDDANGRYRRERFEKLCKTMKLQGLDTVDVSLLQPAPHWDKGYAHDAIPDEEAARADVMQKLVSLAGNQGIKVGCCADDLRLLKTLNSDLAENAFQTRCLDRGKLDKVFGLETPQIDENGCGCQLSLDPCQGKQFGCASGCQYCYVPFTKVPKDT
jgi:hypothetical protein